MTAKSQSFKITEKLALIFLAQEKKEQVVWAYAYIPKLKDRPPTGMTVLSIRTVNHFGVTIRHLNMIN